MLGLSTNFHSILQEYLVILWKYFNEFSIIQFQDALNSAGAVLYTECDLRFSHNNISSLVSKALKTNILLVEQEGPSLANQKHAVTSLTHPKMFEYFQTVVDNFQFTPMISVQSMLVYNTDTIHENVMLPWVQCALIQECIYPIGEF